MNILSRLRGIQAFTHRTVPFWLGGAGLLLVAGWLALSRGQIGAQPVELLPLGIKGPRLFSQCLLAVDSTPVAMSELRVLQDAITRTRGAEATEVVALIEAFIDENPTSPWVPSLQVALGGHAFGEGRYTAALDHWYQGWDLARQYPTGPGRVVADLALAEWTRLLAELGRLEELAVVMKEVGDRPLEGGASGEKYQGTRELYEKLSRNPAAAYRCGWMVLDELSTAVRGQGVAREQSERMYREGNLLVGCSMGELVRVSDAEQLGLVGVERPEEVLDLPVPSVMHLALGHYVVLLHRYEGRVWVYDPLRGGRRYLREEALNEEASGRFLVFGGEVPPGWRYLAAEELSMTLGKCMTPQDPEEYACTTCLCPPGMTGGTAGGGQGSGGFGDCKGGCMGANAAKGMMRWSVSEPNLNLWLEDTPLECPRKDGSSLPFTLRYKHRDARPTSEDAFSFGLNWECNWLSWVDISYGFDVYLPEGGRLAFEFPQGQTQASSYFNNSRLTQDFTQGNLSGFTLDLPDGQQYKYSMLWWPHRYYMTQRTDARGVVVNFNYAEVEDQYQNFGLRLVSLTDDAAQTLFTLQYAESNVLFGHLVTSVTTRGTTAYIDYVNDYSPHVSLVEDGAGIQSALLYDWYGRVGFPTNLTTPYGSTSFMLPQISPARGIEIVEPDNGRQIYLLFEDCDALWNGNPWLPTSVPAGLVPSVPTSYLLDTNMNTFNSFHWNARQAENVPTIMTVVGRELFTTNHFNKARMRHWLGKEVGGTTPDFALGYERAPSADDAGNTLGQITWHDYSGKTYSDIRGTQVLPSLVARKMPDNTTWTQRSTRNAFGNVTQEVETWVDLSSVSRSRTNTYYYAANGVDLVAHLGPGNTLETGYAYNTLYPHRPVTVTNGVGEITRHYYDSSLREIGAARPTGHRITNYYGSSGFLAASIEWMGTNAFRTNGYSWTNGRLSTRTNELGLRLSYTWDGLGRPLTVTYPDATYFENRYTNAAGVKLLQRTAERDRLGKWTYTVYTPLGQVERIVDPLGRITRYTYCSCGGPETMTRAYGQSMAQTTTYSYNNRGVLTQITEADQTYVQKVPDALDRLAIETDAFGSRTNYYDNLGRLSVVENAGGVVLDQEYDDHDLPATATDANGVTVSHTYDALHRPRTRTISGGGTEAWGYSANVSGPTSFTNQVSKVTLFAYDAAGRKTSEVQVGVFTNSFTYIASGDLETLRDGMNQTTTWKYHPEGQVKEKWYQGQSTADLVYGYNANGWLTGRLSRTGTGTSTNGYWTAFAYDAVGNLTNVAYPSGTPSVTNWFDALNRLTSRLDGMGTTAYTYSVLGSGLNTLTENGPWTSDEVTVTNRYGRRGGLSLVQPGTGVPVFIVTNSWDASGRWKAVGGTAGTFTYSYAANSASSLPIKLLQPGNGYITNRYDSQARLTLTELRTSSNVVLNAHGYQLNHAHQRTLSGRTNSAVSSWNGYVNHLYDPAGQLTNAWSYLTNGTPVTTEKWGYGYDPAQNLAKRTNNTTVETFAVNALNQLTTIPNSTPLYDRRGNLTQRTFSGSQQWVYTYDSENRLTSVATDTYYTPEASRWKWEFFYDGQGRLRVAQKYTWSGGAWYGSGGTTRYLYDGMLLIQERDGGGTPTVTYTRGRDLSGSLEGAGGIGGLLARSHGYSAGTWSTHNLYHADGNGNVGALVNGAGALQASYKYDPYGRYLGGSGTVAAANQLRWSSKLWVGFGGSATDGLYYYGYRFYDPYLQRWMNRDSVNELGSALLRHRSVAINVPDELNLYGFIANQPVGSIDAFGLSKQEYEACVDSARRVQAACISDCRKLTDVGRAAGGGLSALPIPPPWGIATKVCGVGGVWVINKLANRCIDRCIFNYARDERNCLEKHLYDK